jgi:aspartate ammonia-lyase
MTHTGVATVQSRSIAVPNRTRREHDSLGSWDVPTQAYYGVHTARALQNFPISGTAVATYPDFVNALAAVKQAAAAANRELGLLDSERAEAIEAACVEIRGGALHDQVAVDVLQGGVGSSTNMHVNEVIANRALEILGDRRGDYDRLHPLEHVNRSRSTNDVYPAIKVALQVYIAALHAMRWRSLRPSSPRPRIRLGVEDGPHPIARRGPDDAGSGIRHLRNHGCRGCRTPAGGCATGR